MINLCFPFVLTDTKQIPKKSKLKREVFLEANIFDAIELQKIIKDNKLDGLFKNASKLGIIRAFHFPTENADYINSNNLKKLLINTIQMVGKNKIPYLVLHSNYIRQLNKFDHSKLPEVRKKFIKFYKSLDKIALKSNVTICIENLPIIGNNGDDFDSIFVFPKDFEKLISNNINITWDLGHWAYTCEVFPKLFDYIGLEENHIKNINDFIKLKKNISRFHFSSFKDKKTGSYFPSCEEGIIPQLGDYNEKNLIQTCRLINKWPKNIDMTLEIKESDYHKRENLYLTIDWFNRNVFKPQKS